jgi:hypothetical protein
MVAASAPKPQLAATLLHRALNCLQKLYSVAQAPLLLFCAVLLQQTVQAASKHPLQTQHSIVYKSAFSSTNELCRAIIAANDEVRLQQQVGQPLLFCCMQRG